MASDRHAKPPNKRRRESFEGPIHKDGKYNVDHRPAPRSPKGGFGSAISKDVSDADAKRRKTNPAGPERKTFPRPMHNAKEPTTTTTPSFIQTLNSSDEIAPSSGADASQTTASVDQDATHSDTVQDRAKTVYTIPNDKASSQETSVADPTAADTQTITPERKQSGVPEPINAGNMSNEALAAPPQSAPAAQELPDEDPDDFDMFGDHDLGSASPSDADAHMHANTIEADVVSAVPVTVDSVRTDLYAKARRHDNVPKEQWDDKDGFLNLNVHELLNPNSKTSPQYQIISSLGQGTFATVVRCLEHPKPLDGVARYVAIKVARNRPEMENTARHEAKILRELNDRDPHDKHHIVRLGQNFIYKNHLCLIFEMLDTDLRKHLEQGNKHGLKLEEVRRFARQLFSALQHLQDNGIIHADLKPDNILIQRATDTTPSSVKLGDFGSAVKTIDAVPWNERLSRYYRSPEVMLGCDSTYAVDVWALGVTLFELATGEILFKGTNNHQMLAKIQACRGKVPKSVLNQASLTKSGHWSLHFNGMLFREQEGSMKTVTIHSTPVNGQGIGARVHDRLGATRRVQEEDTHSIKQFIDLLDKCLQLDIHRRIQPQEALRHPFLAAVRQPKAGKP